MIPSHPYPILRSAPAPVRRAGIGVLIVVCAALFNVGCAGSRQQEFASADQAVQGLITALRADDTESLRRILGRGSEDLVESGDPVRDRQNAERFLQAYDQRNALVPDPAGGMTLEVGPEGWPLPIPVVQDASTGNWRFDTDAGMDEIINRRIGRNELNVIEVCRAIADAQQDYAAMDPDGDGIAEYARSIISSEGKRDGLYWPTGEGEAASPLGPLVAEAVEEGYSATSGGGEPRPYHGYCYRLLHAQGPNAAGGAMDYVISGRMIGGFAAVAYPADYGSSGIMTFMVDRQGVVYQKDLGPDTERVARAMKAFDPGPGWQVVPKETTAAAAPATPAKGQ